MPVSVRSFAKINLGLAIGPRREDGFHELRTVYQTIALHDRVRVEVASGRGIEIRCGHPGVPENESNTCHRMAELALAALDARRHVTIHIEKRLPVQGGLGAASSNAAATLFGLERALKARLPAAERMRLAAAVGSDVPLFLLGGTVLGLGRGEEVYPLEDLPPLSCVVATPEISVSTPQAFADWDKLAGTDAGGKLTGGDESDRISACSHSMVGWLSGSPTGVPAKGGDRAEALLLDLVRTGIENDFEQVVFPQYPELRDVKSALIASGARYVSLSGSGSALYGLFGSAAAAKKAAARLKKQGIPALATMTLPRRGYWKRMLGF
ncbi:MAG TPA: 4-(cytidine 5'-diphospho)-2-C-methyl-D-erythritol kinase [Terriglobales bacterium]|nr:4-(cytidine 5'-diphospho)-2-C-methyl-D-erythritol kinase [Terriglobales bacterium]